MAKKRAPARGAASPPKRPPTPDERRSVIITFKPKDRRPDPSTDKLDLVRAHLTTAVSFVDSAAIQGAESIPASLDPSAVGYDVNDYDAPIVVASLTAAEIRALERDGNVEKVEPDGECYALPLEDWDSTSSSFGGAAELRAPESLLIEGQPSVLAETIPGGVAQIKAHLAWNCTRAQGIRVAVLDTGIDARHPDLAPNFAGGVSFVPGQTFADGNGHGTHCAGTIAAAVNGSGVVGVAPNASVLAVKVLSNSGSGNWSWLIAGIDWCVKNKVRVLSMSLGGSAAPSALQTMCDSAFKRGVLLVAAAGNNGGTVGFPAQYGSVIAVSAIDSANQLAPFSSRGAKIELCAPGVNVLSTMPGGRHGKMSGTSMACPHVSGAAALAWGAHRFASNITIRRLLAWTADNLGVPGRDPLFGFGRVDAQQAASALVPPPAIPGLP